MKLFNYSILFFALVVFNIPTTKNNYRKTSSIDLTPKCWSPLSINDIITINKLHKKIQTDEKLKNNPLAQYNYIEKKLRKDSNAKKIKTALFATMGIIQSELWAMYFQEYTKLRQDKIELNNINVFSIYIKNFIEISEQFKKNYEERKNNFLKSLEDESFNQGLNFNNKQEINIIKKQFRKKLNSQNLSEHFEVLFGNWNDLVINSRIHQGLNPIETKYFFVTKKLINDFKYYLKHIGVSDEETKKITINFTNLLEQITLDILKDFNAVRSTGKILNFIYPYFSQDIVWNFQTALNNTESKSNKFWCALASTEQMTLSPMMKMIHFSDDSTIISKAFQLIEDKVSNQVKWSLINIRNKLLGNQIEHHEIEELLIGKLQTSDDSNDKLSDENKNSIDNFNHSFVKKLQLIKQFNQQSYEYLKINHEEVYQSDKKYIYGPNLLSSISNLLNFYKTYDDQKYDFINLEESFPQYYEICNEISLISKNRTGFIFAFARLLAKYESFLAFGSFSEIPTKYNFFEDRWILFLKAEGLKINKELRFIDRNKKNISPGELIIDSSKNFLRDGMTSQSVMTIIVYNYLLEKNYSLEQINELYSWFTQNKIGQDTYNLLFNDHYRNGESNIEIINEIFMKSEFETQQSI